MGVTIHFEGQLKNATAFDDLMNYITRIGTANTWLTETFENHHTKLLRVRNEEDWDYEGPTKGITLYIHEDCDPIRLEFDRDLYIQEYVKTQFAGFQIHMKVIGLLKNLRQFFNEFEVVDEGEYWETENKIQLVKHLRACDEAIADEARKHPGAQVKVKDPEGRLIDLLK